MAVLADSKLKQLEYFESHTPIWVAAGSGLGLSDMQTAELAQRTAQARAAYGELVAIRAAAQSATQKWYDTWGRMADVGREDIRSIKAFAESRPNPLSVYTAAQVDPPATPGGAGTGPLPGTPGSFKVALNPATGALTITWKCVGGDGHAVYLVTRQYANQSAPTFLTVAPRKRVTDTSLGALETASLPVTYFITCTRGPLSGQTASITVRLGAGGAGGAVVQSGQEFKMAA